MMTRSYLSLILIQLTACVAPDYRPPVGQETASLTVVSNTPESFNQGVTIFRGADCSDYPGQLVGVLYSRTAGIQSRESVDTSVPTGAPVIISVFAGVPSDASFFDMFSKELHERAAEIRYCQAFVQFKPEPGEAYRAAYKIDGSPCSLTLMKMKDGQGIHVTEGRPNVACAKKAKERLGTAVLTN
jgi:hypothetical protein